MSQTVVTAPCTWYATEAYISVKVGIIDRTIHVICHEHIPRHQFLHFTLTLANLIKHGLAGTLYDAILVDTFNHQVLIVNHVTSTAILVLSLRLGRIMLNLMIKDGVQPNTSFNVIVCLCW